MDGKFLSFAGRMGLFRSDLRSNILVTEDLYLKISKYLQIICVKQIKGGNTNLLIIRTRLVYSKKPTGPQGIQKRF
jgi:hypothetical protein